MFEVFPNLLTALWGHWKLRNNPHLKKQYLIMTIIVSGLLMTSLVFNGCSFNNVHGIDENELSSIREKNLQENIKSLQESTSAEDEGSSVPAVHDIDGPITLADAVAYALKYNLDVAIKKLECDIQEETAIGARLKMLPSLSLNGELSRSNEYVASFSNSFENNTGAQAYNYSRDKTIRKSNLELSWDILDFSISYYQQKQAFNRLNIEDQKRHRVIQNLKFDVTETFLQVQVSKAAMDMAGRLVDSLQEREKILQDQFDSRNVSEIEVLETSAALSEMKMKMSEYEREFQKNKQKLATLIGLVKKSDFEVEEVDFNFEIEEMDLKLKKLELEALRQRPELFEQDLEELITVDEARITVAKMAPGLSIFYRLNYDHDSHLYYDHWHDIGFRISFDLLSIPQKWSRKREVQKKKELIRKRRLSLAAAILTQLNLAIIDYKDAIRKYRQSKEIGLKRTQLMYARRRHVELGNGKIEDVLESEAKFLFSHERALSFYADVIIAEQRIINTVGREGITNVHFLRANKDQVQVPVLGSVDVFFPESYSPAVQKGDIPESKRTDVPDYRLMEKKSVSNISSTSGSGFPYSIRLSSWRTVKKARQVLSHFKGMGLTPYTVKVNFGGEGTWWRCFSGCYKKKEDALRVIADLDLADATVNKTPFANFVGSYTTESAMQDVFRELEQLDFFPYVLRDENNTFWLFTGAFFTRRGVERQNADLKSNGIPAQVVLR